MTVKKIFLVIVGCISLGIGAVGAVSTNISIFDADNGLLYGKFRETK